MSSDQAGDSKEPMPSSSGSSSSDRGDQGILSKILDAIKSLLSGGAGQAQADQMGPGLVQQHTNQLNAYANPDSLNPQATPMPTPQGAPQIQPPQQAQTPMAMRSPMGGAPGAPAMGGIPPQMQLAMARQRMQPQMGQQSEDMSKYQKPVGRG